MRPVMAGLVAYDKLVDGTLSIFDIARLNDALTVRSENERRLKAALERK